jgi:membrane associated rhomboid family serine protease
MTRLVRMMVACMFPISDDNPTLRTPVMTYLIFGTIAFVWIFLQGAGLEGAALAASVCTWGMVPGELTGLAPLGFGVQLTETPQLNAIRPEASGGVAVWAHVGGFVAGLVLIKLFENRKYTSQRTLWRHRLHPDHP